MRDVSHGLPAKFCGNTCNIGKILHAASNPGHLSFLLLQERSVGKCGSCGGRNFVLPIDKAHRLYNILLLPHKPWWLSSVISTVN